MYKPLPTLDVLAQQVYYENEFDFPKSLNDIEKVNNMIKKLLDKHGFGLTYDMAKYAIIGELLRRIKSTQ